MRCPFCNNGEIEDKKVSAAYVTWINSDLTEGRGFNYPHYVCKTMTVAERKSRGQNTMGSDADITKELIFDVGTVPYGPVHIEQPEREEIEIEKRRVERDTMIAKAKSLGMTDDDLKKLIS